MTRIHRSSILQCTQLPLPTAIATTVIIICTISLMTVVASAEGAGNASPAMAEIPLDTCGRCPVCTFPTSWSVSLSPRCWLGLGTNENTPIESELSRCLEWHMGGLVGQDHIMERIEELLKNKILYPDRPLAMHFCGDNGVGKTYLAEIISSAWSLHQHPSCGGGGHSSKGDSSNPKYSCQMGASLLKIKGSRYSRVEESEVISTAKGIWAEIEQHLITFPHGIILIDDFSSMAPLLVKSIGPFLFGGEGPLPLNNNKNIKFERAIVIATSDFKGKNYRRSMHSSPQDLEAAISKEVIAKLGYNTLKNMELFPFYSLSDREIEDLIKIRVQRLKCRNPTLGRAKITQEALSYFVSTILAQDDRLRQDSGRHVDREFRKTFEHRVTRFFADHGSDEKFNLIVTKVGELPEREKQQLAMAGKPDMDNGGRYPHPEWKAVSTTKNNLELFFHMIPAGYSALVAPQEQQQQLDDDSGSSGTTVAAAGTESGEETIIEGEEGNEDAKREL